VELRDYQIDLKRQIYAAWAKGNQRVLAQLPTGGGKTALFSAIVRDAIARSHQVLVLAHRVELIDQIRNTLAKYKIFAGLILSGYDFSLAPVQVASVQTLSRRLKTTPIDPKLVIVDEAHHACAASYRKILDRFPQSKVLGVSATPCRSDGLGLGEVFEILVEGATISSLIERGYLVPPQYFCAKSAIEGLQIRETAGDYHLGDLARVIKKAKLEGDLVKEWKQKAEGQQTICFAVNVEHSLDIVRAYQEAGVTAAHIDCSTPKKERQVILARFAKGATTVLCNVGIVTEGFDVPACAAVQLARPTKSLALYHQMVGRALRPAEGKDRATILDHAGCWLEFGCVTEPVAWTLLGKVVKAEPKEKEAAPDWIDLKQKKARFVTSDDREVLIAVDGSKDLFWLRELHRLLAAQREKGYKRVWVAHQLAKRFPLLTLAQWRLVAKVLGYKRGWAEHFIEGVAS
jgi:superfamily II DNA or RNA helicase